MTITIVLPSELAVEARIDDTLARGIQIVVQDREATGRRTYGCCFSRDRNAIAAWAEIDDPPVGSYAAKLADRSHTRVEL